MKKMTRIAVVLISLVFASSAMAMKDMDHGTKEEGSMEQSSMDHSKMDHGSETKDGTFKHAVMAEDVHAEFQVMELASMNMKDPEGNTHHVMATFKRGDEKIDTIAGKVKLISPSGKEQLASLKDFGSGIFAANFTIDEPGKWGVVCVFKEPQGQHTVKFWYPHMAM